jgi:predicted ATPase
MGCRSFGREREITAMSYALELVKKGHGRLVAAIGEAGLRNASRRDEARATLADLYNWFTEGFVTHDLREAKGLLDELAA